MDNMLMLILKLFDERLYMNRIKYDSKLLKLALEQSLKDAGIEYVTEYRFDKKRRWRFDYCMPNLRIAIELEGGIYSLGRHTRGKGYENDREKYNSATMQGWRVMCVTYGMINSGYINTIVDYILSCTPIIDRNFIYRFS